MKVARVKTTKGRTIVEIGKMSTRAADWFVQTGPGLDLHERRIYPNIKEVTEAWAMHQACRKNIPGWGMDPGHLCIEVGAGSTPRASAMILFRTGSPTEAISIDPDMKVEDYRIDRLRRVYKGTLGAYLNEYGKEIYSSEKTPVILLPHSHAPQDEIESLAFLLRGRETWWVEMPCCVRHNMAERLFHPQLKAEYEDRSCWSEKNRIRVWKTN